MIYLKEYSIRYSSIFKCNFKRSHYILFYLSLRTKWKRQTAVGIELLTEAGNVAALQQMYRGLGYTWPGVAPSHPALTPGLSPFSTLDMYYR